MLLQQPEPRQVLYRKVLGGHRYNRAVLNLLLILGKAYENKSVILILTEVTHLVVKAHLSPITLCYITDIKPY